MPETTDRTLRTLCDEQALVDPDVLRAVLHLAVEIAREGREGRRIGTLFTVGDAEAVLARSRPMILDPLAGHPPEAKRVTDPDLRETLKELAQLDGAFVVDGEGVVRSAARYLDASPEGLHLPLGLGTRHHAAAAITRATDTLAIVVSESAVVRLFEGGRITGEVLPELWLLEHHGRNDFRLHRPGRS